MTCGSCVAKAKSLLSKIEGVENAEVQLNSPQATITMANMVPVSSLQSALNSGSNYKITALEGEAGVGGSNASFLNKQVGTIRGSLGNATLLNVQNSAIAASLKNMLNATPGNMLENALEAPRSWFETYKPILVVFAYILGVTLLVEFARGAFLWDVWMTNFMAGFFLVFSFFKLLNLKGFAESYASYDLVAKRWSQWGYVYAFIELALGVAYVLRFMPLLTNVIALVVMSLSIIGVLQSVLNKQKIQCACLGTVFNLPMSTVTIIEDGVMIVMSAAMIITLM